MKKLMIAVFGVLFFAPLAFADGWGVGVKVGVAESDPKDIKETYHAFGGELNEGYGVFSVEGLHEWNLGSEADKIGVKLGIDSYGETEWKVTGAKVEENTFAIPLTVYYKRDNGIKDWSFFAGAGVTYIYSELEAMGLLNEKDHKGKVFPHVAVGAEYRFTKLFALGLDARYNFAAKVKKDGDVYSDRSGFGAAITGRFYF